jgi:phage FluMu protein Com
MIPGPALRKECPYCKEVKELMSHRSGNTFRGTHWSDTKKEYPMLPKNSDVQKCPGCGKYYFLADAKTLPPGEDRWRSLYELFSNGEIDDSDI